jgi:hypothetical protein
MEGATDINFFDGLGMWCMENHITFTHTTLKGLK